MGKTLDEITKLLIGLRKQTESADMEKARLFSLVQQGKLYKDQYGTFANYCESIGYTRQHVYSLMRIHAIPAIRQAQPEIGTMAANAIVSAADVVDHSQVIDLIGYAKEHTAKETADHAKQIKLIAQSEDPPIPQADPEITLPIALAKQTKLLQQKSDLENQLAEINQALSDLYQTIKKLSRLCQTERS